MSKIAEAVPFWAWVDIEASGLEVPNNHILEVGIKITKRGSTQVLHETSVCIQPSGYIDVMVAAMVPFVRDMHTSSGLIDRIKTEGVSLGEADRVISGFIQQHGAKGSYMCGSTVNYDRKFLQAYMPLTFACFHYRSMDVSSLREAFEAQGYKIPAPTRVKKSHRALDDLDDSIELYGQCMGAAVREVGGELDKPDLIHLLKGIGPGDYDGMEKCGRLGRLLLDSWVWDDVELKNASKEELLALYRELKVDRGKTPWYRGFWDI